LGKIDHPMTEVTIASVAWLGLSIIAWGKGFSGAAVVFVFLALVCTYVMED
jgi:hypothetical protein